MKFLFEHYDTIRRQPYPNLWAKVIVDYYNETKEYYNYDVYTQNFILHTTHSELYTNLINDDKNYYKIVGENIKENEKYFYPIEMYGDHNNLIKESKISKDGIIYETAFIKIISKTVIELIKENKVKVVINCSHEPMSDIEFLDKFSEQILSIGLKESDFIFFVGSSNIYDLHPSLKNRGFSFYFEDSIIISTAKKIKNLKNEPNFTLGYKTEWISETEIDVPRTKHFVCLNRNSNKNFRYTLGCFFEALNLWDNVYASFLKTNEDKHHMFETNNKNFDELLLSAAESFSKKLPIEIDTQNSDDKEGFEVAKAFKKEIYLNSYIYIVTETNFKTNIFITEKICNPIAVLQPFILFGAPGYLKYIKTLGFKTFDTFIDESYDDIENDETRYLKLCNEIERISKLPLEELHSWYLSIQDILIHNRNHLISFTDKVMYKDNLEKNIKLWK